MLGLAIIYTTVDNIGKKKRYISSFLLVTLLVMSGLLGIFIKFDNTNVYAAELFSDMFEDSDFSNYDVLIVGGGTYSRNTSVYYGGAGSLELNDTSSGGVVSVGNTTVLTDPGNWSWEAYVYPVADSGQLSLSVADDFDGGNNRVVFLLYHDGVNWTVRCSVQIGGVADDHNFYGENYVADGQWTGLRVTHNMSSTSVTFYIKNCTSGDWTQLYEDTSYISSILDEFGFYTGTARTGKILLDNFTMWNTPTGWPIIGDPECTLSGLSSGQITFGGEAGDVLWSNETIDVDITDGASDVLWVNVSLFDVSDGGVNVIDAEDFNLSVSAYQSTNFFSLGAFPNGGGNITINSSTWTGAGGVGNPFPITGGDHIYLRFELTVPGDQEAATYNIELYPCKVYIGG